jgi:hypothetical protein
MSLLPRLKASSMVVLKSVGVVLAIRVVNTTIGHRALTWFKCILPP